MHRVKKYFINTLILFVTSIALRSTGMFVSVSLSGAIGAGGLGLWHLITSVYVLGVTLASSGIRLASTRLCVIYGGNISAVVRRCIAYSLFFGVSAAVLFWNCAPFAAQRLLDDVRAVQAMRVISLSLPFVALSSALSGCFTARRSALTLSVSQLAEQLVTAAVSLSLIYALRGRGLGAACAALAAGEVAGQLVCCIMLAAAYFVRREKPRAKVRGIGRTLISIALPDAVSSYMRSALVTCEHLLIPWGLRRCGSTGIGAVEAYGTVSGMAIPVIMFPYALLDGLFAMLIPEIAESHERGHVKNTVYIISRIYFVTLAIGAGSACVLISLGDMLARSLYGSAQAGSFIRALALLCPLMYIDTATDSVLRGLGEQKNVMRVNILDSCLSIVLLYVLLPKTGIWGYIVTMYSAELINFTLSARQMCRATGFSADLKKCVLLPALSALGSGALIKAAYPLFGPAVPWGLGIIAAVLVYAAFLCATRAVEREDIEWFFSSLKK